MKQNLISPQTMEIYKALLRADKPTDAKTLGEMLGIFPNSIYRAIKELEGYGLIKKLSRRPIHFRARPTEGVVDEILFSYRDLLIKSFPSGKCERKVEDDFGVSFIQDRDKWLKSSMNDLQSAEKEYFSIVSGDEVPAEVILTNKRAVERGVEIRIIIQRYDTENREMMENWKRIGMKIRFCPTIKIRVTIIDARIVYLISYDPEDYKKALGVRIAYPPIASFMREMFCQRWKQSQNF
jgi:sugar-specific transcriptional regulator TrmB